MTRRTFYRKLRSIATNYVWSSKLGIIEGEARQLDWVEQRKFYPITAVYFEETGNFTCSDTEAAELLKLSDEDTTALIVGSMLMRYKQPRKYNPVRRAITRATGLDK